MSRENEDDDRMHWWEWLPLLVLILLVSLFRYVDKE